MGTEIVLAIACPVCDAPAGSPCTFAEDTQPSGADAVHNARVDATDVDDERDRRCPVCNGDGGFAWRVCPQCNEPTIPIGSMPTATALVERFGEPDDFASSSDVDNLDRVSWALAALGTFTECTHHAPQDLEAVSVDALRDQTWAHEIVGDLLANLFHLVTVCGHDVDDMIETGLSHFRSEVGEGYGHPADDAADDDFEDIATDDEVQP